MTRAMVLALIALLSTNAFAAEPAVPAQPAAAAAPGTADPATCADPASEEANRQKREAALAELGRRLAAEPKPDRESRALNRTGHNYGSYMADSSPPPAKPSGASDTKPH